VSGTSGANAVSDGSDANNPATVSEENPTAENATAASHEAHEPHIQVLKGEPTAAELAALIAVLGSAAGRRVEPAPQERSRWGLPVDKLRYPVFSWQKVTLLERTHMRR
jgi:hypothetical protein